MDKEIVDSMQQAYRLPGHQGKSASMIKVDSNVDRKKDARQQSNSEAAARQHATAREKRLWAEYDHLEEEQEELYQARTMQSNTLWQNFAKQRQGPAGFFLGA